MGTEQPRGVVEARTRRPLACPARAGPPGAPRRSRADAAGVAISATSSGSNSSPASPTTSGSPVAVDEATGRPASNASQTGSPQPSNLLGKTSAGPELVEAAELERADEAREGGRLRQAELDRTSSRTRRIVPCLPAGADERDRHPALVPDSARAPRAAARGSCAARSAPGRGGRTRAARAARAAGRGHRGWGPGTRGGPSRRARRVTFSGGGRSCSMKSRAAPGGHRHDQRGPLAVGAVDRSPAARAPRR